MGKYQKITPSILTELIEIVGKKYILYDQPEKMAAYSHDEVADPGYAHMPEVVIKPSSADEISRIMRLANHHHIPVTPRGAGSGLSGGAVPSYQGIVLSVERMNRILEVDIDNLVVVVEPGVITNEINNVLKEDGLFFAGYPMSVESCFIGGNVAENAGGGKAIKYGVTGRYILGLEVVLPTGEIVTLGGKLSKDVVGYDLIHLMTGSEGTLGIFTKIILKLLPLPTAKADLLVLFPDALTAMKNVPLIMRNGRIIPTAIEFMDQLSVQTTCKYLNEELPYEKAGAMLLIEVDGSSEQQVEQEYETIGKLCEENGAMEVYVALNHTTQERVWAVRRNIAEAFKVYSPVQSLEDIVIPFARIPDIIPRLDELSQRYPVIIPCYGHAGDGNLHVTLVKKPEFPIEKWPEIQHDVLVELYKITKELGGTISGEHGIGSKRREFMHLVMDEGLMELQRQIKNVFDPNQILNPGKIFPEPSSPEKSPRGLK
ncbi:MAG: FAD-binding oxidoreductase [Anaerolineaceae bacterium]